MGALVNLVEQDMGNRVQSVGCKVWGAGHRKWGVGCGEWGTEHGTESMSCLRVSTAPAERWLSVASTIPSVKLSFYSRRELRAAKEQVFWVFFIALTH